MQIIFDFICFIFLLVSNAFYNYLQEIHLKMLKRCFGRRKITSLSIWYVNQCVNIYCHRKMVYLCP